MTTALLAWLIFASVVVFFLYVAMGLLTWTRGRPLLPLWLLLLALFVPPVLPFLFLYVLVVSWWLVPKTIVLALHPVPPPRRHRVTFGGNHV
jgi:hypothetical protein